jgi:hypothetical protein
MAAKKVIKLEPKIVQKRQHIVTRWGGHEELFAGGWVAVPAIFLKGYASFKPWGMNSMEAMLVLQLMVHKWDAKDPYPSYNTLAKRLGKTEGYARSLARSLQGKGLLTRVIRTGTTNRFNLRPLFDKLKAHAIAEKSKRAKRAKSA